jgi:hypothetical protein
MSRASDTGQVTTSNFDISVLIGSKVSNARVAMGSGADNSKTVTSGSDIPYTTSVNVNDIRARRALQMTAAAGKRSYGDVSRAVSDMKNPCPPTVAEQCNQGQKVTKRHKPWQWHARRFDLGALPKVAVSNRLGP